jgi:hypothetical protein
MREYMLCYAEKTIYIFLSPFPIAVHIHIFGMRLDGETEAGDFLKTDEENESLRGREGSCVKSVNYVVDETQIWRHIIREHNCTINFKM